ncbi:MAG: hypothetical protein K0S33_3916 [Bacteroidetes bacterium]|jgi:hypothetical protein|nr:hypothetical protein [Bacteroidota bacterium]
MYSRAETAQLKQGFWTAFGRYLSLFPNSEGQKINWVNYHTGYKDVYFRMEAGPKKASVAIELTHSDELLRGLYYEKLESCRLLLFNALEEKWSWEPDTLDESGKTISRVYTELPGVSIYNQSDWPAIISFLKPRIIALDIFWNEVKDLFEELR